MWTDRVSIEPNFRPEFRQIVKNLLECWNVKWAWDGLGTGKFQAPEMPEITKIFNRFGTRLRSLVNTEMNSMWNYRTKKCWALCKTSQNSYKRSCHVSMSIIRFIFHLSLLFWKIKPYWLCHFLLFMHPVYRNIVDQWRCSIIFEIHIMERPHLVDMKIDTGN